MCRRASACGQIYIRYHSTAAAAAAAATPTRPAHQRAERTCCNKVHKYKVHTNSRTNERTRTHTHECYAVRVRIYVLPTTGSIIMLSNRVANKSNTQGGKYTQPYINTHAHTHIYLSVTSCSNVRVLVGWPSERRALHNMQLSACVWRGTLWR